MVTLSSVVEVAVIPAQESRALAARSRCTISVGVAVCAAIAPDEVAQLLARADEALYNAKAKGRDLVELAA